MSLITTKQKHILIKNGYKDKNINLLTVNQASKIINSLLNNKEIPIFENKETNVYDKDGILIIIDDYDIIEKDKENFEIDFSKL
jgi:hypothetical protein